jgi:hypothetical protein
MNHPPATGAHRQIIALNAALAVVLGTAITVALGAGGDPTSRSGTPMSGTTTSVSYTVSVPTPDPAQR